VAIFEGPLSIRSLGLGTRYVYGVGEYHKKYLQNLAKVFSCLLDEGIVRFKSNDFLKLQSNLVIVNSLVNTFR
jgi:hypothetical protein